MLSSSVYKVLITTSYHYACARVSIQDPSAARYAVFNIYSFKYTFH